MNASDNTSSLVRRCIVFGEEFEAVSHISSNYRYNHIVVLITNILLCASTIMFNSLTTVAFSKSSQLRARVSHFFIHVQSIADLVVGFVASPLLAVNLTTSFVSCEWYFAARRVVSTLAMFSMTVLFGINFERYFGVVHPLFHRRAVTMDALRKYVAVAIVWNLVSLGLGFASIVAFQLYARVG